MDFLRKQWFLISLVAVLSIGMLAPTLLEALASWSRLRHVIVTLVMFMMALTVDTRVAWQSIRRPWPALLGSAINIVLVPCLAILLSRLLRGELSIGIIVAASVPCTLASAAVWTRRADGNDVTAILITLLTNATCFLWMPIWIVLGTQTQTEITFAEIGSRLLWLVVVPMGSAQVCRTVHVVASTANRYRSTLGICAQIGILLMVLIAAVNSRLTLREIDVAESVSVLQVLGMVAIVIVIHVTSLVLAYRLGSLFGLPRSECIPVAFGGSQKTLMVGLDVALQYFGGLAALPMLVYHISQLLIDTLIADRWRSMGSNTRRP